MKRGAIFDQDGILFDTESIYQKCWIVAGEELGLDVPAEFPKAISGTSGAGMEAVIRRYFPDVDVQTYVDRCYALAYEEQDRFLPKKPGLHEILSLFKENGVKIALASGSLRPRVDTNLATAGIRDYFDAIVTCEDVTNGKPAPDTFQLAAEQLGLDPSDCYVFEDSYNGVRAGHAAGCFTVMVPDLVQPDETIAGLYDALCPSLLDVVDNIQNGTF